MEEDSMKWVMEEMKTLRKNKKGILEIDNVVTEMKNGFHGLISKIDTAKERTNELEGRSIETF